ncbi:hypothetical protein BGZ51_006398 [Haplosporangium sp. Z 767]|nr:hypothetical protein BGZ51_006398 [Haplosporangium sp. Z 767]
MFRLVNKRLAINRELESLKQEFNQCSLPIEFVHRIVVNCVDEIMERGLYHPFILKNPCPPSVVGSSTPTPGNHRINTVNSLLTHPNFPPVNKALLLELLNLSLAILNRSSFNRVKPDMLASILGPHIFATQHATILQHTPQQAYSFGWGVALVHDIKRCSKMFYVLLGGYRREVLGTDEWECEQGLSSALAPLSTSTSSSSLRGQVRCRLGSTATIHGSGSGMASACTDQDEDRQQYFGQNAQKRLFRSVPHLRVTPENTDNYSSGHPLSRYGMERNVSTTLSESIRAAAAMEAKQWNLEQPTYKGPSALKHLRGASHIPQQQQQQYPASPGYTRPSNRSWIGRQQHQQQSHPQPRPPTIEERQQELFQLRFRSSSASHLQDSSDGMDELNRAFRHHNLHNGDLCSSGEDGLGETGDMSQQREKKRLEIEQMIHNCRGSGLNFAPGESEPPQDLW